MIVIVYLSLALAVLALVFFFVSTARTMKRMNKTVARLAKNGELMRRRSEKIAKEKNELTQNFLMMQFDLFKKKQRVQSLMGQGRQIVILTQENIYKVKKILTKKKA